MSEFSHLRNKLLAEQVEDRLPLHFGYPHRAGGKAAQ